MEQNSVGLTGPFHQPPCRAPRGCLSSVFPKEPVTWKNNLPANCPAATQGRFGSGLPGGHHGSRAWRIQSKATKRMLVAPAGRRDQTSMLNRTASVLDWVAGRLQSCHRTTVWSSPAARYAAFGSWVVEMADCSPCLGTHNSVYKGVGVYPLRGVLA